MERIDTLWKSEERILKTKSKIGKKPREKEEKKRKAHNNLGQNRE